MSSCESNDKHTNYCSECATCHDCLEENQVNIEQKLADSNAKLNWLLSRVGVGNLGVYLPTEHGSARDIRESIVNIEAALLEESVNDNSFHRNEYKGDNSIDNLTFCSHKKDGK